MKISVIMPAYNEGKGIVAAVEAVREYCTPIYDTDFEVIVVDDGSTDDTVVKMQPLLERYVWLQYVKNETNRGKGFSVRRGMLAAQGEFLLFLDADLSTPITELPKLLARCTDQTIAIGSRALPESVIVRHQARIKEIVARLGNLLIRLFLGLPIKDTQCGFKLFPARAKKIFAQVTIDRWGFDMEILFIAKRQGYSIVEIPIMWTNEPSSLVRGRDYLGVLGDIVRILTRWFRGRYTEVR